ncbi:MAG: hypothetical protein KatS3mg124_1496 [Porticoccaceae bacterium]|nr:MAG: hypothetical protein KatS3mg124_1496 [Porticoccaceae bacterium]
MNSQQLARIWQDARQVIVDPVSHFRALERSGGFGPPVLFVAVMALCAAVVALLLGALGLAPGPGVAGLVLMPLFAVLGSFVAAAVLLLVWKLLGSQENYETAYRCLAATTALYPIAALLAIIPYLGGLVALAWATWLLVVASEEVHRIPRRKAAIALGILAALLALANLGAERAARHAEKRAAQLERELEEWQRLPPEEAGRRLGEFLKGLEEGSGAAER